jgi:hypothetical protein
VKNSSRGKAIGKGKTRSVSNRNKSASSAKGKVGADTDSVFNKSFKNRRDNWSAKKQGKNWRVDRDNWDDEEATQTKSAASGRGDADASTRSDMTGSANSAKGKKGSRGQTVSKHSRKNTRR